MHGTRNERYSFKKFKFSAYNHESITKVCVCVYLQVLGCNIELFLTRGCRKKMVDGSWFRERQNDQLVNQRSLDTGICVLCQIHFP